jgi:hypothetical protein
VKPFFDARPDRTPVASWVDFLREVVLAEVAEPIVLIIDEIDRTRTLPFSPDPFFGAIRSMENARALDDAWRRWTVCLCGVATPADLVEDPRLPPLVPDEGVIRLRDLTRAELDGFAEGLASLGGDTARWLDAVHGWTSGHPAMTQKLCGALLAAGDENGTEAERVDRIARKLYVEEGRTEDALLLDVERRFPLGALPEAAVAVLSTYQAVRTSKSAPPFRLNDPSHVRLVISGLATEREGRLVLRSRIYAEAFDDAWVAARLEGRPIALRLAAWLKSDRKDAELLAGEELSRAQGWAAGRELTATERELLAASERRHESEERAREQREREEQEKERLEEEERQRALERAARKRLAIIAAVAVAVALAMGGVVIWALRERDAARRAEHQAQVAELQATQNADEAKRNADEAKRNADEAEKQKADADKARDTVKTQAQQYKEDLAKLGTKVEAAKSLAELKKIQAELKAKGGAADPLKGIGGSVPPPP